MSDFHFVDREQILRQHGEVRQPAGRDRAFPARREFRIGGSGRSGE
jgi:hypothetical protein